MLKSYLTVALKHLTTRKLYSAINIVGLAMGLACFILIALFVHHSSFPTCSRRQAVAKCDRFRLGPAGDDQRQCRFVAEQSGKTAADVP